MSKLLVEHIRDKEGRPFATVVSDGIDRVGLSICHNRMEKPVRPKQDGEYSALFEPIKDYFNKRRGITIATGRMDWGVEELLTLVPNRTIDNITLFDIIQHKLDIMLKRAIKYFK